MAFQGKEFTQGMKQLVVNLKQFYDVEKRRNNLKADWVIEQTAKGLDIGEATVRRIMAEYNKNKNQIPEDCPKARGRPENRVPKELQTVVRQFIRSQNLKGQYVSVEVVRDHLSNLSREYTFPVTTLWRTLSRWGFTYGTGKRRSALKERDYVIFSEKSITQTKTS